MNRRSFLHTTGLALGASLLSNPTPAHAGQFTGKIRKSLKWGMAANAAKVQSQTVLTKAELEAK